MKQFRRKTGILAILLAAGCSAESQFGSAGNDGSNAPAPQSGSSDEGFDSQASVEFDDSNQKPSIPVNIAGANLVDLECATVRYETTGAQTSQAVTSPAPSAIYKTACVALNGSGEILSSAAGNIDFIGKVTAQSESDSPVVGIDHSGQNRTFSLYYFESPEPLEAIGVGVAQEGGGFQYLDLQFVPSGMPGPVSFVTKGVFDQVHRSKNEQEAAHRQAAASILQEVLAAEQNPSKHRALGRIKLVADKNYMDRLKESLTSASSQISSKLPESGTNQVGTQEIATTSPPRGGTESQNVSVAQPPANTNQLIDVAQLCGASSQVIRTTATITIPENDATCQWLVAPSSSALPQNSTNGIKNGIRSTTLPIPFPANSVVCEVELTTDQNFTADDIFILNLNNVIVATNQVQDSNTTDPLSGLRTFDWNQEKSGPFKNNADHNAPYCPNTGDNAACQLPPPGPGSGSGVRIHLKQAFGHTSKAFNPMASQADLRLDVVGDDNPSDCRHDALTVTAVLKTVSLVPGQ